MQPLSAQDLKSHEEYERERDIIRRKVIALKEHRRISVGDRIAFVFENRDTLLFQIQEILRVEHIVDPGKIQEEVQVYNELLPRRGELSTTLLIEVTDSSTVKNVLDSLQGIDRDKTVALYIGQRQVNGVFERGRSAEEKISAVHYVRFRVPEELVEPMRNPAVPVGILIDHPNYQAIALMPVKMRFSLLNDLVTD